MLFRSRQADTKLAAGTGRLAFDGCRHVNRSIARSVQLESAGRIVPCETSIASARESGLVVCASYAKTVATSLSQPSGNASSTIRALTRGVHELTKRSTLRVTRLFAVGILTLLMCLGISALYVGWPPFGGTSGFILTDTGYVAMTIGLMAAILLGLGIGLLIHHEPR